MAETTAVLLETLLSGEVSITGADLKTMIQSMLDNADEYPMSEIDIAHSIWDNYFNHSNNCKEPLPKVFYYLYNSGGRVYNVSRDERLSPRGTDFFRKPAVSEEVQKPDDIGLLSLRDVLRYRWPIDGKELKDLCEMTLNSEADTVIGGYGQYQQQIAQAILDEFYSEEGKCPKAGVYYRVVLPKYAEPKVYRDRELSPKIKRDIVSL